MASNSTSSGITWANLDPSEIIDGRHVLGSLLLFFCIVFLMKKAYTKFLETLEYKILTRHCARNKTLLERALLLIGVKYLTYTSYSIDVESKWPAITKLPVDELPMHDDYDEIQANQGLNPPLDTTKFLKELGWVYRNATNGKSDTRRNNVIDEIIEPIASIITGFDSWMTTSSYLKDTYQIVLQKIDKAPCEDHKHFNRMWHCYRAIAHFIRKRCPAGLQRLSDERVIETTNKKSSIGQRERDLIGKYNNMGEYIRAVADWKVRVEKFKCHLLRGQPINASFETNAKREVKDSPGGRLIWALCPTARIYENQIFGHLDVLLKELPYSVSGVSNIKYGELIWQVMNRIKRVRAVCDDVRGWDTKISYSILCIEAAFIQLLTDDKQHQEEIRAMYGLYAHPLVWINRPFLSSTQRVLYRLRGQVASGRRVTYSMNTITNIVVTMCRAAYSQDIPEDQMYDWSLDILDKGHSNSYGGKISGDDSVIIMNEQNAIKFATKGVKFMNDIGMPRKNREVTEKSEVLYRMEDIDFCSHRYSLVEFFKENKNRKTIRLWMPTRGIDEILAKCSIVKNGNIDSNDLSWARAQALTLMVMYFHIPIVQLVARAILSVTPNNCDYNHLPMETTRKPWIQEGDLLSIINECYFHNRGKKCRLISMNDLAEAKVKNSPYVKDIDTNNDIYVKWRKSLVERIKIMRSDGEQYDDWIEDDWFKRSWLSSIMYYLRPRYSRWPSDNPV